MDAHGIGLAVAAALPAAAACGCAAVLRRVRTGPQPPPRAAAFARSAALSVTVALWLALGAELWLRYARDTTDSLCVLESSKRWFDRHWKLNNQGFRDDADWEVGPVPDGRRRVTFVGDSFTAGQGIADPADRLANRVRRARTDWEVHVVAANGWETGAESDYVTVRIPERTGGRYGFDVVVLAVCLNDLADLADSSWRTGDMIRAFRDKGPLTRGSDLCDLLRFLWVASRHEELRSFFPHLAAAYEDGTWDRQAARLAEFAERIRSLGGTPVAVTWPLLDQMGPGYPFATAHARIAALWTRLGVPHADLLEAFRAEDPRSLVVGRFDAHPNERANAIAADFVLPLLDRVAAARRPK
ncbi:MAG: hypothetical protein HMLKMBBP_01750 [Planctomycetes bacterium]|nr:hypothetical protein [Planctomycetota bacterium]